MRFKYFVLVFLIFALAGCSAMPAVEATQAATESTAISVVDGNGTTIELEKPAVRIVSLSPSVTEILFAIGAGSRVAGREDSVVFPEEALQVASVGSTYSELPTEAILALEPDLVVAGEIITAEQVEALKALNVTIFWQSNPTDFDGLYKNINELGTLTGNIKEAEALVKDLQDRVAVVSEKVSAVEEKPSVFYELDGTDPANPWTSGGGTFIDTIITLAGGTNITTDMESYAQISTEELATRNPAVILLGDAMYGITPESVAARPAWNVMTAVVNNAIYGIDPYILSVPGPRLVDGLEEAARLIHPELFEK